VLNVEQFQRFMSVIKRLGDRVEKEHDQFLRDSQRIEDRSATAGNGTSGPVSFVGNVDFESLVGSGGATRATSTKSETNTSWDDDVWGSIFNSGDVCAYLLVSTSTVLTRISSLRRHPPRQSRCIPIRSQHETQYSLRSPLPLQLVL
jgi:SCY1-like protein 2